MGYYQLTQKDGLRWSSSKAFLDPARSRPNLTVLTLTQALGIEWSGTRATGVVVEQWGRHRTIGVNQELVLSAGAYMSPHLLLVSGVGPADELKGHGIDVTIDLPGVGRNLQDHPGCFISLPAVDQSPSDPNTGPDEERLMRDGTGPMTWTEVGGFVKTDSDLTAPDLQFHAALGIVPADGLPAGADRGVGFGPYVSRPVSRGKVTLRSAIPHAKPRITNNLMSDAADWSLLRQGVQISMEIASQRAWAGSGLRSLKEAADAELAPRSTSDRDVDDFLRANTFAFFHAAGSCSMGDVVDERLRLYGAENVRVADASVMPRVLTGNLNAACMMIGSRAAQFLLDDA
jgi:choline dehydrogenase-like flavoprotein